MDRRIRAFGITFSPLLAKIWKVYCSRFYRRQILFQHSSFCSRFLRIDCLVYLYRWANARSWGRFLKIFRSKYCKWCPYRNGNCFILCCTRRDERYHVHPGSAILRTNICLYGTCGFHFVFGNWKCYSTTWVWRYRFRRGLSSRQIRWASQRVGFS
ncbi:MAG: Uncharacterised protein [Bacteroidota bacterium]|nr:MAG: Uncharacterised protein [Bacteroidota bacterium]